MALLLTNLLPCNEEASSIFNQSPGWQKTWENRTTTKLLVNATQKRPKLQATTSMQSGLHEHETAPQQQQLVDCLCKTLAVLYQNFTQHLVKLSLSLSLSLYTQSSPLQQQNGFGWNLKMGRMGIFLIATKSFFLNLKIDKMGILLISNKRSFFPNLKMGKLGVFFL